MRRLILTAIVATLASPAFATGVMSCKVAAVDMKPKADLEAQLVKEGWQIKKSKVDGGCYEVYGTMPDGTFVEAYFDPATFEKLYVSQRGKVLYKKGE